MPESFGAHGGNLSIGELSRRTGVHIETIRYYEKIGMLPKPRRTGGGRRAYGPDQTRLLAFIRRARELGFSLDEIRALLAIEQSNDGSCAEVRSIATLNLRASAPSSPISCDWRAFSRIGSRNAQGRPRLPVPCSICSERRAARESKISLDLRARSKS